MSLIQQVYNRNPLADVLAHRDRVALELLDHLSEGTEIENATASRGGWTVEYRTPNGIVIVTAVRNTDDWHYSVYEGPAIVADLVVGCVSLEDLPDYL